MFSEKNYVSTTVQLMQNIIFRYHNAPLLTENDQSQLRRVYNFSIKIIVKCFCMFL